MTRFALLFLVLGLAGCSASRFAVQAALPLVESQILAMQEESDPDFAEKAIPANLKMLEGLLKQDPENTWILENLAEGFCGYAFSFLEDTEPGRASSLYERGKDYALRATIIRTGREKYSADIPSIFPAVRLPIYPEMIFIDVWQRVEHKSARSRWE